MEVEEYASKSVRCSTAETGLTLVKAIGSNIYAFLHFHLFM